MRRLSRTTRSRRYLAAGTVALACGALALGTLQGPASARTSGPPVGVPAIQHPVFKDGKAMPVFTEPPADYVEQELWVKSSTDSDHDGKPDMIHIDVTRVKETEHGL